MHVAEHERLGNRLFFAGGALLLIAFPVMSQDYGMTFDEMLAHVYGERIVNYYLSGFKDQSAKNFYNLHFYGGFFEVLGVLGVRAAGELGLNRFFENMFDVRHVVNSLFGWLMVAFAGLLGKRLFGVWAGILSGLLLLATPRFLGHACNNPKDVPFAALFLGGLYALSFMRSGYPFMTGRAALGAALLTGLAMAVRIGGLLLICYAGMQLALQAFKDRGELTGRRVSVVGVSFLGFVTLALLVSALFSPWQLENPFLRPLIALREMSHLVGYPDAVIFEGRTWSYLELPRRFLPEWLLISTPLGVMAGLALFLVFLKNWTRPLLCVTLVVSVFFPVVYTVVKHPPLYHDMRHFFFILGPACVLAAGGYVLAYRSLRRLGRSPLWRRTVWAVFAGGLLVGAWHPVSFIFRNHPNEAVYFNQIAGGYPGGFHLYELDYWMNASKQARAWIRSMEPLNGRGLDDYELVNMNMGPEDRLKVMKDPSIVHGIFVDGYPVMLIRLKKSKGSAP